MWWQLTAVQVISELQYTKAVKPLVVALLTPTKTSTLGATHPVRAPQDGEGRRAGAHQGAQRRATPTTRSAGEACGDDKSEHRRRRRACSRHSVAPAGRDAILAALPRRRHRHGAHRARAGARADAERPARRAGVPRRVQEAHLGLDATTLLGQLKPRIALAQQSANFYDPKLIDWLLKEMKARAGLRGRSSCSSRPRSS